MKNMKKIMSLFLALVMLVGVAVPVFANNGNTPEDPAAGTSKEANAVTNSVTLHKMLISKENIKARKVTVNLGTAEKPNNVSKVVVQKEGKYYDAKTNKELNSTDATQKKFIDGFAGGTPVFAGHEGLDGTKYDGREIKDPATYFGEKTPMANVYFAWQEKGKETTTIQVNGEDKTVPQYIKGKAGNLSTPDLTELKEDPQDTNKVTGYKINYTTKIDEAFGGSTTTDGIKFDTSKLKGTFLIQEIKEKSKYLNEGKTIVDQRAVPVEITLPLVNEYGTVLDAHVYPKNVEDKPLIDKNFIRRHGLKEAIAKGGETNKIINAGAQYENYQKEKAQVTANVGQVIPYEVKTKIAKGTAYEKLIWNDNMTNGLTYNKDLGNSKTYKDLLVKDEKDQTATKDVVTGIKLYKKEAGAEIANPKYKNDGSTPNEPEKIKSDVEVTLDAKDYTIVEDDKGFRLMFTKDGLDKISNITKPADVNGQAQEAYDVEVVLTYTATVNGSTKVDNPEKNNITLEYGHKPGKDIDKKDVKPKDKALEVVKSFDTNPVDDDAKNKFVLSYTLEENGTAIATVTLTSADTNGEIFDLGNGIKFEVTGEFAGKFTGLDDKKTYSFYERVAGYNPEYTAIENGKVTIKNKKDSDNPPPLNPTEPKVVTGGKKFVKTNDYDKNDANLKRLLGAQFIVKRTVKKDDKDVTQYLVSKADASKTKDQAALVAAEKTYREAVEAYNEAIKTATGANTAEKENNVKIKLPKEDKLTSTDKNADWEDVTGKTNISTRIEKLREVYEAAFKTAGTLYEWKTPETGKEGKDIANVVILTSDFEGRFEIQGLAYGEYFLEEIKAPNDFAKIADQKFVVGEGTYQGEDSELKYYPNEPGGPNSDLLPPHGYGQQVKNKKVTIPETGGIGTVIFTVVGISLMAGAFIAMRKRTAEEN